MTRSKSGRAIEKLLFDLKPHALDYLRVLGEGSMTVSDVAEEFGVSAKTVTAALKDLDGKYSKLVPDAGIARPSGALIDSWGRAYKLTPAGRHIANNLALLHQRKLEAFETALSTQVEAWLRVANDSWADFSELAKAASPHVILRPKSQRSAAIDLHLSTGGRPDRVGDTYALYSVCLEASDIRKGQLLTSLPGARDHNTSLIVADVQEFRVLAHPRTFDDPTAVPAKDLLSDRCQLVVPEGGAVPDYLDLVEPGWERRLRPVRATDLEACLGVARHGGLRGPVMIVHGFNDDKAPPGFRSYPIQDGPGALAVRGLFHRNHPVDTRWSVVDREAWNHVWSCADNLWHRAIRP